jgi:hypothetical protein
MSLIKKGLGVMSAAYHRLSGADHFDGKPYPHVYSPFGIPADRFRTTPEKVKILIDPSPNYFSFQMRSDLKKYPKILLIHGCEPPEVNDIQKQVIKHGSKFTKVYSFDERVLASVPGSELFCFGSCWICAGKNNYVNEFSVAKDFRLSFVRSSKKDQPGHKLRHELGDLLGRRYPFEVYFPKERIDSKEPLFKNVMFHLAIENTRNRNYFSEKLIDCFMSYTLPVYWGCTNIGDHFDADGIIQFQTKEELRRILETLTPGDYSRRLKAIQDNYAIAKEKYAFFFERVDELVSKL